MAAAAEEGVIKFELEYTPTADVSAGAIEQLNHWRTILFEYQLIGQDDVRYGGYGYGNVSQRIDVDEPVRSDSFVISGTQTGGIRTLAADHYARVLACDLQHNRVIADGPVKPSSESLTHAAIYAQAGNIRCVLHVHSNDIWHRAQRIDVPCTRADVAYGTPAMAAEVARLFQSTDVLARQILVMAGHEDGIIAFGNTPEQAGMVLLETLAQCS